MGGWAGGRVGAHAHGRACVRACVGGWVGVRGMAWRGVAWRGVAWRGVACCVVLWCGVLCCAVLCCAVCCVVLCCVVLCCVVLCCVVLCVCVFVFLRWFCTRSEPGSALRIDSRRCSSWSWLAECLGVDIPAKRGRRGRGVRDPMPLISASPRENGTMNVIPGGPPPPSPRLPEIPI